MISARKLQIYAKYSGDIDGWVRMATDSEAHDISDQDWRDIGEIIQRMGVIKSGRASADFANETERLALGAVDGPDTLDALWRLA